LALHISRINYKEKILLLFIIILIKFLNKAEEWIKYDKNPIIGNRETGSLFDPCIIQNGNLYKMYVSWRKYNVIALSTSEDGINWSDLKIVLNKGNFNCWDSTINRASVIMKDGTYHMWFTGQHKKTSKIGYATSSDGINFNKSDNPVLVPEYQFEENSIMNPHVIFDEEEKIYKMWYSAGEQREPDVIGYAISKNGFNWLKLKNPVFRPSDNKLHLDSFKVGGCEVHKLSKKFYLMFYIGYSNIATSSIFIAKSKNGIDNWIRSSNPIIKPTKDKFDSHACYKPSAIFNEKLKIWMLYYNGRKNNEEYIGLATLNKYEIKIP